MNKISKRHHRNILFNNRYGATTLFLAIILSSVIFVESTYLFATILANRRVLINRALKNQVEAILGDYDRELFNVYGIYGFCKGELDDFVFNSVLTQNGIDPDGYLTIDNYQILKSEDLKKVISSYYSYRGLSVITNGFTDVIIGALEEMEDDYILSKLKDLTSGKAPTLINEILKGSERIGEILSSIENFTGIDDAEGKISDYIDLFEDFSYSKNHTPNLDNSISFQSVNSLYSIFEGIDSVATRSSDILSGNLLHIPLCHYATYNFDTKMEEDYSINSTRLEDLHFDNYSDVEYILTGLEGNSAEKVINTNIFLICLLSEILQIRSDATKMNIINGIAVVMDVIVSVITLGAGAFIPIQAYKALIILIYGIVLAINDVNAILDGKSVQLFSVNGVPLLEDGLLVFEYRDFLFSMMLFKNDDILCDRMIEILERDFGEMVKRVSLGFVDKNQYLSFEEGYYLYED